MERSKDGAPLSGANTKVEPDCRSFASLWMTRWGLKVRAVPLLNQNAIQEWGTLYCCAGTTGGHRAGPTSHFEMIDPNKP
jgi:hypothetical protein